MEMTLAQAWFWFTIITAAYLAYELWKAPLQDWRDDPTSHNYTDSDNGCQLCRYPEVWHD